MIGKFEESVLLAVMQAGEQALPSEIHARLEGVSGGKPPAFGAVYTTLGRMAAKGLVEEATKLDEAQRKRRCFTISGAGRRALTESMQQIRALGGFALAGGGYA
ncbi:hypothetical protein FIM10_03970 [Sphingomonadales bacterium 56]|uniref:PadR family transcriptional regulator n=1 Tax=unclassified Sphingobium TaxID=2611147 RepID=UPI00191A7017|nr:MULTISPECIES: helix-turn-helix transcriptional regulator [unclassified Sphingobium]MBY2927832.1 hypothetical protein [Sphingomonadales bacterium 56]MBY2957932.1 hypothetical protein [Sphingomonadales bacterium 58]CAD7336024.1 hypothetical protein SPHS6_00803 [Sphingobium sp. S6]CAD7336087.1 hypothetical protein SPHS8_00843 [Sphingobium sp. S8]